MGADICECTYAPLLAFCAPARMDWHNAMLSLFLYFYHLKFKLAETESTLDVLLNAALVRIIMGGNAVDF